MSNLSYAIATVVAGFIADKYGLIAARTFGFFIEIAGFILVTLQRVSAIFALLISCVPSASNLTEIII